MEIVVAWIIALPLWLIALELRDINKNIKNGK